MSFTEVLEQLHALTTEQRQMLIRRALEIEDQPLSEEDERIISSRLAEHRKHPTSSIPLEDFKSRLRKRSAK